MMNDVDEVLRSIDPFIHKYLVTAFNMRTDNIRLLLFAYNFDVFLNGSNPRYANYMYLLVEHTTVSTVQISLVLYHTPVWISLSSSSICHASAPSSLPIIVVPL